MSLLIRLISVCVHIKVFSTLCKSFTDIHPVVYVHSSASLPQANKIDFNEELLMLYKIADYHHHYFGAGRALSMVLDLLSGTSH